MRVEDGFIGGFIPKPDGMRCVLVGMREDGGLLYAGKLLQGRHKNNGRRCGNDWNNCTGLARF